MNDPVVNEVLVVTTTVDTMENALQLAREVVARRLAACVQIDPIAASVYRWDGKVREDPELRLTMKTLAAMQGALGSFIEGHHPYELPQLTWTTMGCTPGYGAWVRSEVTIAA